MSLANIVNKTLLLGVGLSLLVNAACSPVQAQNNPSATETRPAVTATYTPTAIPTNTATATPEPIYQEVQGVRVPTNVTIEEGIPMMIQGEEKLINYFWYGEAGQNFSRDLELSGNVYVIGDVNAQNVTCVDSPQVYVDANNDVHDLYAHYGEAYERSGINNEYENLDGVHKGEPFRDEKNHVSIQILGNLDCSGTEENQVLITSASENPMIYDWNFFTFVQGTISHATIEYYRYLNFEKRGEISYSTLRNVGECALCLYDVLEGDIIGNSIYNEHDKGHELIALNGSTVNLIDNTLGPNSSSCVNISRGSPYLDNNSFENCSWAYDNRGAIVFLGIPRETQITESNTFINIPSGYEIMYEYIFEGPEIPVSYSSLDRFIDGTGIP